MVPIPANLPLLIGKVTDAQAAVVERILKGQSDLKTNLMDLGKHFKVRVWFSKEVDIRIQRHWVNQGENTRLCRQHVKTDNHVFNYITYAQGQPGRIIYGTSRKCRSGYDFPSLDLVTRYEPVIRTERATAEFKSYEQFAAKFDRRFITDDMIKDLWNSKSAQHGGRYCPSDFHRIGPKGKEVLDLFLRLFKDVNDTVGEHYHESDGYKYLRHGRNAYHPSGRDISLSHTLGVPRVSYSSEYSGCGNGRYGMLANKNEFLWLEDD